MCFFCRLWLVCFLQVMVMFAVMTMPTLTYGNLSDSNWLAAVMLCFSVVPLQLVVVIVDEHGS